MIADSPRLYLNSPTELPYNWGQINVNHNDYHSDSMEISSTFRIPYITDWWWQQVETHSNYTDFANVAHDIFSIIPHCIWVEASFPLGRDVIGWRQSKPTVETLPETVILRQFARANDRSLAGDDPALDMPNTANDLEMKREAEQKKLPRMAKVHYFLKMWQGSQNLCATQKESRAQNKQMTAVGYISDTEDIVKASWSNFQHDGAAAFKLLERSPAPPALSAKDHPGGWTQVLNVRQIKWIDCHPAECDEDSSPETISDTENWLDWTENFNNLNDSEQDWEADNESEIELDNGVRDSETQGQWDMSVTLNVPALIRPTWRSNTKAEKVLMAVSTMETRRNKGIKKM